MLRGVVALSCLLSGAHGLAGKLTDATWEAQALRKDVNTIAMCAAPCSTLCCTVLAATLCRHTIADAATCRSQRQALMAGYLAGSSSTVAVAPDGGLQHSAYAAYRSLVSTWH